MPFDDRDFPDLPRSERAATPRAKRLVGLWLYGIAAMILVMIGLGGATRLTGSGLSIDPLPSQPLPFLSNLFFSSAESACFSVPACFSFAAARSGG